MQTIRRGVLKIREFCIQHSAVLFFACMAVLAFTGGMQRIFNVEFSPTNGDFQSYNVFRRALDGQWPFVDFANYLGMGPLILHVPLLLFHNTFAGSLFVTHFVCAVLYMLLCYCVYYTIGGQKLPAMAASLVTMRLTNTEFFDLIPYVAAPLRLLAAPNNSQRMTRMFLAVLFGLLLLYFTKKSMHRHPGASACEVYTDWCCSPKTMLGMGMILGSGVLWSNDFGYACLCSALIILTVFWVQAKCSGRRILWAPVTFLAGAVLGVLIAATLFTGGRPMAYLSSSAGVAGWQFWYFGVQPQEKVGSVAQLLANKDFLATLAFTFAVAARCLVRLVRKTLTAGDTAHAFLCLASFGAALLYAVGSGAFALTEATYSVIFLTAAAFFLRGGLALIKWVRLQEPMRLAAAGVSVAVVALTIWQNAGLVRAYKGADFPSRPEYIASMKGVSSLSGVLREMRDVVGSRDVFSIYATMLELDMGTFQPTGYDYIIHALGEEASNRYAQQFCELRPAFVQTLDPNACAWEGWVSRENWTFYRELLARYRPVKEAGFWRLWERLPDGQSGIVDAQVQVSIKEESENAVRIVLTSEYKEPCTVDLSLTYTTHIPSLWQRLQTWNQAVCVEEENLSLSSGGQYTHYYLPAEAQQKPVGVAMVDGRAEIVLRSQPTAYTEISVQEARVNGVLQKIA